MRAALLGVALAAMAFPAPALELDAHQKLTREIYAQLIAIRTVHPDGDNTAAARAMAQRLLDAGFEAKDVEVLEPAPRKGNLLARLRGSGELKPLLLLAHIDVVEARKEDWSDGLDPFVLTEKDGYYYGRGTIDDKAQAAIFVAHLIRAKREGWKPRRDLVLALTADEEGGTHNGVAWLLRNRREDLEAEFAINEGGALREREGRIVMQAVQVSEKVPLTYEFEAINAGGHSSMPRADNAIYDLAGALERLRRHAFPVRMNYVARRMAARSAEYEQGDLAEALRALAAGAATPAQVDLVSLRPNFNAQLRTTCVATQLQAGHAANALPQRAQAVVNCRLLPGEDPAFVQSELARVAGERVVVKPRHAPRTSEPSDPQSPVMAAIQKVTEAMWPGVPVVPVMSAGATDGSQLRNAGIPVYGVSGLVIDGARMHGRDERIAVKDFYAGAAFLDRLIRDLSQ